MSVILNNKNYLIDDYNDLNQEINDIDFENSLSFKIDNIIIDSEIGNSLIAMSKDGEKHDVIFEDDMANYEFESLLHVGDEIVINGFIDDLNALHISNILKIITVDERKRG